MLLDRSALGQWLWPIAIVLFFLLVVMSSNIPAAGATV